MSETCLRFAFDVPPVPTFSSPAMADRLRPQRLTPSLLHLSASQRPDSSPPARLRLSLSPAEEVGIPRDQWGAASVDQGIGWMPTSAALGERV